MTIPAVLERAASRLEHEAGLFSGLLPALALRLIYEEAGGLLRADPDGPTYEAATCAAKEFALETAHRLRQAAREWERQNVEEPDLG